MKNRIERMIASGLAVLISIPTIIQGTSVILGSRTPDQIVLLWLVYYNVVTAILSLFAVVLLWWKGAAGRRLSFMILSGHVCVLFLLLFIYFSGGQVASRSILAMAMRSVLWGIINALIRKDRRLSA